MPPGSLDALASVMRYFLTNCNKHAWCSGGNIDARTWGGACRLTSTSRARAVQAGRCRWAGAAAPQPGLQPPPPALCTRNWAGTALGAVARAFRGLNLADRPGSAWVGMACCGVLGRRAPCAPLGRAGAPHRPLLPQGTLTSVPTEPRLLCHPRVAAHPSPAPVGRVTQSQGHHGEGADPRGAGGGRWGDHAAMHRCRRLRAALVDRGQCRRADAAAGRGPGRPSISVQPSQAAPTLRPSNPRSPLPPCP